MSINPIHFPGQFTGHVPVPLHLVPDDTGARLMRERRNARAVEVLLDYTALPHPVTEATPDYAHVVVTSIDDLGVWLFERGGEVRISPPHMGVRLYVLITHTDAARDGSSVEVRVSCAVPEGAAVMPEIAAAVAR